MEKPRVSIVNRLKVKMSLGPISGLGNVFLCIVSLIWLFIVELIWPAETIDVAEEFSREVYKAKPDAFGDHEFDVRTAE